MKKLFIPLVFLLALSCSSGDDTDTINELKANAVNISKGRVNAWFPTDSLTSSEMEGIVDTLNLAIASAERLIGDGDWRIFKGQTITYYFATGRFVPYASKEGEVFIPVFRLKNYQAPLFHETNHILLRSAKGNWNNSSQLVTFFSMPIWLTEGVPEYLALKIEEADSLKKADNFKYGGMRNVDATCATILKGEFGESILSSIGETGVPTKLFTDDRRRFVAPYYTCACSFTKHLAENYGLELLVNAVADFDNEHDVIETTTGKSLSDHREAWLQRLGVEL